MVMQKMHTALLVGTVLLVISGCGKSSDLDAVEVYDILISFVIVMRLLSRCQKNVLARELSMFVGNSRDFVRNVEGKQVRSYLLNRLGANPIDMMQMFHARKRTIPLAELDNPASQRFADVRQLGQFRPTSSIDIHLELHRHRIGSIDLDDPPPKSLLLNETGSHRDQTKEDATANHELFRSPHEQPWLANVVPRRFFRHG